MLRRGSGVRRLAIRRGFRPGRSRRGGVGRRGWGTEHRASANACKHGLASKYIRPASDSAAVFQQTLDDYHAALHPATPLEFALARQMAFAKLRGIEALIAETAAWNRALAAHGNCVTSAFHALTATNKLATILRYQTRFRRQYLLALEIFLDARKDNLPNESSMAAHRHPRE